MQNSKEKIQQIINYLQPLTTLIKWNIDDVFSKNRQQRIMIQRALIIHHLRKYDNIKLFQIRDMMQLRNHATIINMLKFGTGKTNRPARDYFIYVTDVVLTQHDNPEEQAKFAKEINEIYYIDHTGKIQRVADFDETPIASEGITTEEATVAGATSSPADGEAVEGMLSQ